MKVILAPSILSADFGNLEKQFRLLEAEGIEQLHIDIMDGVFVPNISMGLTVVESIRKVTNLFFDTHLMIANPEAYAARFAACGSDNITFHLEAADNPGKVIEIIRKEGKKVGISVKPGTPLSAVEQYLESVDMVLLMTVEPGFGGQAYIGSSTQKIAELREMIERKNLKTDIEVDGGIRSDNVKTVLQAGANVIVAGSSVFHGNIAENVRSFRDAFREFEK